MIDAQECAFATQNLCKEEGKNWLHKDALWALHMHHGKHIPPFKKMQKNSNNNVFFFKKCEHQQAWYPCCSRNEIGSIIKLQCLGAQQDSSAGKRCLPSSLTTEFIPQDPNSGKRELNPTTCPLTSIHTAWHVCMHAHTLNITIKFVKSLDLKASVSWLFHWVI